MTHTRRNAPPAAAALAFAAIAFFDVADANHFILPCDEPCTAARWTLTGSLNVAREKHTATLLPDGKVLVAGGRDPASDWQPLASAEVYDPATGTWSLTAAMAVPRVYHTATALSDGRVLVTGGLWEDGHLTGSHASAEIYDPATGTWHQTGPMIDGHWGHAAARLADGSVLVAGGGWDFNSGIAERFFPETGAWRDAGDNSYYARWGNALTVLDDGKVLLSGAAGYSPYMNPAFAAQRYDPETEEWDFVGEWPAATGEQAASLLPDGGVLCTGGWLVPGSARHFDPETSAWSFAADLSVPRVEHTSTTLATGQVLLAGGYYQTTAEPHPEFLTLASTERFDPATRGWDSGPNLNSPRSGHTATLLADGRVLVAGGNSAASDSPGRALASAEVYGAPVTTRQFDDPRVGNRGGRAP